jgi:outer membrane immunogenic protein
MKRLFLGTACLALSSAAAMAADMSMATKAPSYAPSFSWTRCYVGAQAGGGGFTTDAIGSMNGTGAIAGGQAGCNYQDGNWVLGLEGEAFWSGMKASSNSISGDSVGGFTTSNLTMTNNNDFTIAARAGMAFDRTLVYGKAGWAWGNFKATESSSNVDVSTISQSGYLNGFLVGLGIEHALTQNWTVKLEYDFIGFGVKNFTNSFCIAGDCIPVSNQISSNKQVFKVGANYLFDLGGPVVAKY